LVNAIFVIKPFFARGIRRKTLSMKKTKIVTYCLLMIVALILGCSKSEPTTISEPYAAIKAAFGSNIDLSSLNNYSKQLIPAYILKDNGTGNTITDAKATLGRVLFYDKQLSIDNSISCGSCHKQAFAFGDTATSSKGVITGKTARHAMRLVNARFSDEVKFFWDERAANLEEQTTKPIQDHAEMGFSGLAGRPSIATLLTKLAGIGYYKELFQSVYGDQQVSEPRLQECLSQFIRSIQSFDSKFDAGRALVNNDRAAFPNFTARENTGKDLYLSNPVFDANSNRISGGLGCNQCHKSPEFDIDPNSKNNGIIGTIAGTGTDITVTRSPSLRDIMNIAGVENGPFMHTGNLANIQTVIGHYGNITQTPGNNNLDRKLSPNGAGQRLNLTAQEVSDLIAFLKTLSGNSIYTDKKWSNPFLQISL